MSIKRDFRELPISEEEKSLLKAVLQACKKANLTVNGCGCCGSPFTSYGENLSICKITEEDLDNPVFYNKDNVTFPCWRLTLKRPHVWSASDEEEQLRNSRYLVDIRIKL